MQFLVFSLYLFLVAIPKNTLQYILKREWKHLSAFWKGIKWNYIGNEEQKAARNAPDIMLKPETKVLKTTLV